MAMERYVLLPSQEHVGSLPAGFAADLLPVAGDEMAGGVLVVRGGLALPGGRPAGRDGAAIPGALGGGCRWLDGGQRADGEQCKRAEERRGGKRGDRTGG